MITTETERQRRADDALETAGFYWREREGVRALVCRPLEAYGFTNAFSTRLGGVSPMPQDSLNLAGFNEDDSKNIHENRRRFLNLFAGEWLLTGCWQVHGADVRVVHSAAEAKPKPGVVGDDDYCDALVSQTPGVLLAVKTADCVPVLIGDPATRTFAAVHAGWRGTSQSIVSRAIEVMIAEYGARANDLVAAIGPAANGCCYEVGSEVMDVFQAGFSYANDLLTSSREGRARIDLHAANQRQLVESGLKQTQIYIAPFCTMDRNDLFFSYRREKHLHGRVGRLMSVIGAAPQSESSDQLNPKPPAGR